MPGPVLRKVDAIGLGVTDLEAGIRFYAQLGHGLLWRTETSAGLRLPDSDAEIMLQVERPEQEVDVLVEAVDEATRVIAEAGGSVLVEPFDITIGRCSVVADPWGNRLVLVDDSRGRLVTDAQHRVTGVTKDGWRSRRPRP